VVILFCSTSIVDTGFMCNIYAPFRSTKLSWGHYMYVLGWFLPCPCLDLAGGLSLWNFNIMLPITRARMGLLFGTFRCTVCPIGGALWKHKNCDYSSIMNGISPNFYCMLIWWGYTIYPRLFLFDKFFCPIGGAFWKRKTKSSSRRCGCSSLSKIGAIVM
jgi:hypothetical protein